MQQKKVLNVALIFGAAGIATMLFACPAATRAQDAKREIKVVTWVDFWENMAISRKGFDTTATHNKREIDDATVVRVSAQTLSLKEIDHYLSRDGQAVYVVTVDATDAERALSKFTGKPIGERIIEKPIDVKVLFECSKEDEIECMKILTGLMRRDILIESLGVVFKYHFATIPNKTTFSFFLNSTGTLSR